MVAKHQVGMGDGGQTPGGKVGWWLAGDLEAEVALGILQRERHLHRRPRI